MFAGCLTNRGNFHTARHKYGWLPWVQPGLSESHEIDLQSQVHVVIVLVTPDYQDLDEYDNMVRSLYNRTTPGMLVITC